MYQLLFILFNFYYNFLCLIKTRCLYLTFIKIIMAKYTVYIYVFDSYNYFDFVK